MKYFLTLSLLIIASQLACSTKQPCTVNLADSPELRGFKLGMSLAEIQKKFPGFPEVRANQFGLTTVEMDIDYDNNLLNQEVDTSNFSLRDTLDQKIEMISQLKLSDYPQLSNIKHIKLILVDNKVVRIVIFYPNDLKWKNSDEFLRQVNESLKLDGTWENVLYGYGEVKHLDCGTQRGENLFQAEVGSRTLSFPGLKDPKGPSISSAKFPPVMLRKFDAEFVPVSRASESNSKADNQAQQKKETFTP